MLIIEAEINGSWFEACWDWDEILQRKDFALLCLLSDAEFAKVTGLVFRDGHITIGNISR
jgi:hypothetical protein